MNQDYLWVSRFSSAGELANFAVTSNIINHDLAEILELQRGQTALFSSVQPMVYHPTPNRTIIAFIPSPHCTQHNLPQGGDLVPSPLFEFLSTNEFPSISINRAALALFTSLYDHLSALKAQLTEMEGQLIITGQSLGGSVASLFTLYLLDGIDKRSKCRPICITFGSPLVGNFGLQHSQWNSFFLHLVSTKDQVPGLFLPLQTTVYKPFGTYLFCSELGCVCFHNPDLILKLLTVVSSEVAGELQDVDYGEILRNLENRVVCRGPSPAGERFADPFSAGTIMKLETIGIDETMLLQHNIDIRRMEAEARSLTKNIEASDAKKLNDIKKYMALLEWYKKKSKYANKGYYDCFKHGALKRDIAVGEFMGHLTTYWENMVAQAQWKPQKEGASFRTGWLLSGTTYRRMVEPLDIAAFYRDGGTDYITKGRSQHYRLLQQWYEEDVNPPSRDQLDSRKQKVSDLLTVDSCFWAHVEEAILSCRSLKTAGSTPEQRESSWDNLVKFEEYVMRQIDGYAVSPDIFLKETSFMKWWKLYQDCIDDSRSFRNSRFVGFMKKRSYKQYG